MAMQGSITPSMQLCAEGSVQWVPAAQVLGAAPNAPRSPAMQAAATAGTPPVEPRFVQSAWTPAGYVGPILVTLCCCLIGGIVSIVYTAQANARAESGDIAGAERAKSTARTWMWVSVIIGILFNTGYAIMWAVNSGQIP
jgi:hypothetical protein